MNKFLLTILLAASASAGAEKMTVFDSLSNKIHTMLLKQAFNENRGSGTVVTVGSTGDCDFNSGTTRIQDAIDSGADEVRVKTGTYNESIDINDIDLILKGGYATCADAVADNQTEAPSATVINASFESAAMFISGNTQSNSIEIDHFRITGGTVNGSNGGGGIAIINADTSLSLSDVWLAENTSLFGGGLSIIGDDVGVTAYNLMVNNNSAQTGGGIYCTGSSSILILGDDGNFLGIADNQATNGNGGGVYLSEGCAFTSYVGTSGALFDNRGIIRNTTTNHGGGIYAASGSTVTLSGMMECAFIFCFGYDSQPVNVNNNSAAPDDFGFGGGIYAAGAGTVVNVFNGLIANNEASSGGGVYVTDNAFFYANTTFKKGIDCWSPGSCSQIKGNSASSLGGAVNVSGFAEIYRTHVQNNRADFGTALYSEGPDASIISEGSLFTGNGNNGADGFSDNEVFLALFDGTIELSFATVADNNLPSTSAVISNTSSTTNIRSSIIHEPIDVALIERSTPTAYEFDCVVVHERDSFPGGFAVVVADPHFVDRANGDYHINWMTSPAVDFCDDDEIAPVFTDIDNEERGFDWSGIPDEVGSYDVGFDEQNDIIFKNGFED